MPEIFVFGGCNGSGKSTLANEILAYLKPSPEFVNADVIAAQLNPNDVDAAAITASRLMLERINNLANQKVDFAFETTLAARSFARFLKKCKGEGYKINLTYVWLDSPDLAIERVARRVASGGHDIPQDIIIRRYQRGVKNFFELYSPIADHWIVYDNTEYPTRKITEKPFAQSQVIYQPIIWQQINSSVNP
jgi:predicted ABC-type ATPase